MIHGGVYPLQDGEWNVSDQWSGLIYRVQMAVILVELPKYEILNDFIVRE